MKSNRIALLIIVSALLSLAGCEALEKFSANWTDNTAQTVQTVGDIASPFTGGISSLVAGLAVTVLPTLFAVNRQFLKWKSDKVAAEAQNTTANIVQTIDAAKAVGTTSGVVDFNDPATVKIINAIMTNAAKTAVDAAQEKAA